MKTLLLAGVGMLIVWALAKRLPKPADRVSEAWLKERLRNYQEAEGAGFDADPRPVMKLVKSEASSAPGAYSKPVNG